MLSLLALVTWQRWQVRSRGHEQVWGEGTMVSVGGLALRS